MPTCVTHEYLGCHPLHYFAAYACFHVVAAKFCLMTGVGAEVDGGAEESIAAGGEMVPFASWSSTYDFDSDGGCEEACSLLAFKCEFSRLF
jgi:hypothetical protein